MTLNRIALHNYMIHRDLTADFEGNLIALTGEMGHGKSTFVGAIQFCLTGEHPPWHRDDLLSWGADEGSAKLYFSQDGIECSILRKLHCSDVVLKIGSDTVTGSRNVEKALSERLGVDKDILKQIGFVQQYEIQSILFDDPGKRERSFQKLLGIGDANKIWTELGTIIQSYSKSENFDASIASIKQIISRLNTELKSVEGNLKVSKEALELLPSSAEIQSEITRLTKIQSCISMLADVKRSIAALNTKLEKYTKDNTLLTVKRNEQIALIGCSMEEMEVSIEKLRLEHVSALAELNNMRKLATASGSGSICPLCGSTVSDGQITNHTAAELDRLIKKEKEANKLYYDTNSAYTEVKRNIQNIEYNIQLNNTELSSIAAAIDSDKQREMSILNMFDDLSISPEANIEKIKSDVDSNINELRTDLSQLNELNVQIARLQGEKNAKSQQLNQATEMLNAKVKEKELSEPVVKKLEVLTRVRNWFHSSNGPRTMSTSAINEMTGYVNDYLKELHSEITVMPDNNGLSFAFEYVDGRIVSDPPPSTSKLSGGQKICLALAFRLAIYRYFGQKMGIMVLDEPTAHLSPSGIEYFGELLQTVSKLAKNMNLQIIMPTHEKEIMPFMDSEIHFG